MAVPRLSRAFGRVVDAAPDRILYAEAVRVRQHECNDLVTKRDAFGAAGVGDHHVERQPLGMPTQRTGRTPPIFWISGNSALMLRAI